MLKVFLTISVQAVVLHYYVIHSEVPTSSVCQNFAAIVTGGYAKEAVVNYDKNMFFIVCLYISPLLPVCVDTFGQCNSITTVQHHKT